EVAREGSLFEVPMSLLLERLALNFQDRYRELGELGEAAEAPNLRFGAQLALAVPGKVADRRAWRLVVVGDCGIRVDGDRTLGHPQVAEGVLAAWRGMVVKQVLAAGGTVPQALACGRHYCLAG